MTAPAALRILAVSDQTTEALYCTPCPPHIGKLDLILSCGDLPFDYLEFLLTAYRAPLFYVLGNHDGKIFLRSNGGTSSLPEGGENLEDRTLRYRQLLLAGLGGSVRYNKKPGPQYTQGAMWRRVLLLGIRLEANRIRFGRRLDILVTHSPPRGVHEGEDPAHAGFAALRWLCEWARPRWMLHGHTQFTCPTHTALSTRLGATEVHYIPPYRILEWT